MFTQCALVMLHNHEQTLELFHLWELLFDLMKQEKFITPSQAGALSCDKKVFSEAVFSTHSFQRLADSQAPDSSMFRKDILI